MLTTSIGQLAESAVVDQLKSRRYKILDRNWKTKVCEIDIIAQKNKIIYFVEVKYRSSAAQGTGLEYIGPLKLKRLRFATEIWVQNNQWLGDYRILAASVRSDNNAMIVAEITEIE